jgi:LCP family protein required for cell wall assembly
MGRRLRITPSMAAVRSAVLPGWGQYAQGRRPAALHMFRLVILGLVLLVVALLAGPRRLAAWLVQPRVLVGLIAVNAAVLIFRAFAVWDAWRRAGGAVLALSLAGILAFVAAPHAALGFYQLQTLRLLRAVFPDQAPELPASSTTAPPASSLITSGATPSTRGTTSTTADPTPWQGRRRLTLLLLGADSGPGRTGTRTDTMIVVSIGLESGDVALLGLPRNLSGLRLRDGTPFTAYQGILNEIYAFGLDHPDRYPGDDPGAAAIRQMAEDLTGLPIDYHLLVDLGTFVDVVDALGGVTVYVTEPIVDDSYPKEDGTIIQLRLPMGLQEMDGTTALAYARSRHQSSDYDRMGRQRCLLAALADQASVPALLRALPGLVPVIEASVGTDIPLEALPDLIELTGVVRAGDAIVVGFSPPDWNSGWTEEEFPIPDVAKIREAVRLIVTDPAEARLVYGLARAQDDCGP